jgi:hypothetical protein
MVWRDSLKAFRDLPGVTLEYFVEEANRELADLTKFKFTAEQLNHFLDGLSLDTIRREAKKIEFESLRLSREKERKIELLERAKAEKERTEIELLKIIDLIRPPLVHHLPTLSLRRSQLLRVDHYGRQIREEWDAEINYFILHFLVGGSSKEFDSLRSVKSVESTYNRVFRIIDFASSCWGKAESAEFEWAELDPISFERECANELSRSGWTTRTTSGSGDQGIDVIATTPRVKLVVQCKRYANSVGNSAVQEIIAGREFEKADFAAVISTGIFTKSAQALASSANVFLLHPKGIHSRLSARLFDDEAVVSSQVSKIHDVDDLLAMVLGVLVRSETESKSDLINRAIQFDDSSEEDDLDEVDDEGEDLDDVLLYNKALNILKATQRASTSTLQRRLRIGYNRAAQIMDLLEENGIVGPENGAAPREILADLDRL